MAAAGMAGLLKTVQALRHKTLPPTLNFDSPNRHIDFAKTPFYVNTEARDWPQGPTPRRAAISSFGFSGANGHVLLEEAPQPAIPQPAIPQPAISQPAAPGPRLLLISARTREALAARLADLADWLPTASATIPEIANTLARRRGHFRLRRAIVATTKAEAAAALRAPALRAPALPHDETAESAPLQKLAALYESGADIDWTRLDDGALPPVSLPAYPFAKERFWAFDPNAGLTQTHAALHPLLDANTSTQSKVRFTTNLADNRSIIRDHVVAGRPILPGTAFLEMARAAATIAAESPIRALHDIVWLAPANPTQVTTELAQDGKDLRVTLRDNETLLARARAEIGATAPTTKFDLQAAQSRCPTRQDGAAIYAAFATLGFAYGPSLRLIESLQTGNAEAIGRLTPIDAASTLDAALQIAAAMGLAQAQPGSPTYVPATLASITFNKPLETAAYAHARLIPGDNALTFDITLVDAAGNQVAQLQSLVARPLATPAPIATPAARAFTTTWQDAGPTQPGPATTPILLFGAPALAATIEGQVITVEPGESFARYAQDHFTINPQNPADHARLLEALRPLESLAIIQAWRLAEPTTQPATLANALESTGLETGLRTTELIVRAALAARIRLKLLHAEPLAAANPPPALRAAAAFARSLAAETSQIQIRTIGLAQDAPHNALTQELNDAWTGPEEILRHAQTRTRRTQTETTDPTPPGLGPARRRLPHLRRPRRPRPRHRPAPRQSRGRAHRPPRPHANQPKPNPRP